MEFTAFTVVTGLLTLLLGIGLGRYIWPAVRASDAAALSDAQKEAVRLAERAAGLERHLADQSENRGLAEAEAKAATNEVARLSQREIDLTAQLGELKTRLTREFSKPRGSAKVATTSCKGAVWVSAARTADCNGRT